MNAVASLLQFAPDGERDEKHLYEQLARLATELSATFEVMASVVIGRVQLDLYSHVQDAILTAEAALRSRFYDEERNVFSYCETMSFMYVK